MGSACLPTLELRDMYSELIALFKHLLPSFGYEIVKAIGEAGHTLSQLVKPEANLW